MTTYIPIVGDCQAPLHDRRAVDTVATFLADRDFDSISVGDVSDSTQVGQWARGYPGEMDGKLARHRDTAVQCMLDLRIKHLSRSNHDQRLENYIHKHSPALASLPELRTETFLRLHDHQIEYHRNPYACAPGWLLVHGDEGSLSRNPGGTALGLARKFGRSVVCGHTHRQGIGHDHGSYAGKLVSRLFGLEIGHLMDMRRTGYLKAGSANWQLGIGMLIVDGKDVIPMPLPIVNGKLYFDGKIYRA